MPPPHHGRRRARALPCCDAAAQAYEGWPRRWTPWRRETRSRGRRPLRGWREVGRGGGQAHECAATRSQVPGEETRSRAWCTREACCWGGVGWGRVRERAATRSRGIRGVARPQRPRGPAARPRQSGGSRGARTLLQGGRTQVAGGRACERPRSLRHGRSRRHGAASTCAWARVYSSTRSSRAGRTRRPPSGRAWGVAWAWTWEQGPHEQAQARRRRGRARQ